MDMPLSRCYIKFKHKDDALNVADDVIDCQLWFTIMALKGEGEAN